MRPRRSVALAGSCAALALGPRVTGGQPPPAPPAAAASSTASSTAASAAPVGPSGVGYGVVHGVVYDSLAGRPLAGASVQVARAGDLRDPRAVATDATGAFRVDSLVPGRYLVGFDDPVLDRLRVSVQPRLVEIGLGGDVVRVDLGVPGLASMRPVLCGSPQAPADSSGLLVGRVRDAADGAPLAHATVVLTWSELAFGAGGVHKELRRVPVPADAAGVYVACGVPAGVELVATAAAPGRASGEVALELPPRGLVVRDLTLGDTTAAATPAAVAVARGTAALTGTVRDAAGRPVRGARAAVRGTAAEGVAGDDGGFTLRGLPAGTRTLEVRAAGFALQRVAVDLAPGRAAAADVRLDRVASLAPVTVRGTPATPSTRSLSQRDFLERRRTSGGFGRFVTAADIERRKPSAVTDAVRAVPGVQVAPGGPQGDVILGRGGCPASVFFDGLPLGPNDVIDRWVSPSDVFGIEVYPDAAFAPPEYRGGRLAAVAGTGGGAGAGNTGMGRMSTGTPGNAGNAGTGRNDGAGPRGGGSSGRPGAGAAAMAGASQDNGANGAVGHRAGMPALGAENCSVVLIWTR